MKCLSKVFQPIITIPKNAKIKNTEITCKSQKLLLECGLVRPTSSGLFALLPLGRRALHKLEALTRHSMEEVDAQQVSLPALALAALWEKSGRLQSAPAELLKVDDRHGKKYLLAPTHEEGIADLLADVGPLSYKQLPIILYQISNKYRDEHRPKHGLLRAREFLMMDAYGIHASEECAHNTYAVLTDAYRGLFHKLNLQVHRVAAPAGDMGGSMSHEWQLEAKAGEDELRVCASCSHAARESETDVKQVVKCEECGNETQRRNSIEVGHTFLLGIRYSSSLGAMAALRDGVAQPLLMSCYGIGLTRLLAASLEALSSESALRWPESIAPYNTIIIGPKEGSKESVGSEEHIRLVYEEVLRAGRDAICDGRGHLTIGKRLMQADRMGYPNIIVVGRAALESTPRYELHRSLALNQDSNPQLLTLNQDSNPQLLTLNQDSNPQLLTLEQLIKATSPRERSREIDTA